MAQALVLASVGILAAVLNRLSGGALRTWIPWFTQRLLDLAIKRLPEDQRERFAEEWASHINDMPGDVGKIAFASGCVSAAHEMASLLNNSAFTRFLDQCRDFLNRAMRLCRNSKKIRFAESLRKVQLLLSPRPLNKWSEWT
jgi:hypothetical protein